MASQGSTSATAVNTAVPPVSPGTPATVVTTTTTTATATMTMTMTMTTTTTPTPTSATGFQIVQQQQQKTNNFEPLDKSLSNTLKRNPKMELSKTDLLKLLGYLEGELQGRDIVIAALKSEKMKQFMNLRYRSGTADPYVALMRDVTLVGGSTMDMDGNQVDQQVASLALLVTQQRRTQCRMAKVLKDAEIRHRSVIKELEEEKRKHEHDTAQGDDITYGLEKERTRLKKELELERQEKKMLELELKKENDAFEEEKGRQKQIVLLLLAERKKIIMKYIEERKRSEDLAQILSEEKVRIDSMAEGLEEESKKSLQMEAELEKQLAQFDIERQQYRQALAKEEKRSKELETELERVKAEMDSWKGNAATIRGTGRGGGGGVGVTPPPPPAKPANLIAMPNLRPAGPQGTIKGAVLGTGTPMVSSKVVQPTATVTSVPVSGPTTGIARSVTPGQALRGVAYGATLSQAVVGESLAPIEAQAADNRIVAPPVAATNPAASVPPVPMPGTKLAGKLPYHSATSGPQCGGVGGAPLVSTTPKKPMISRGIPPPVPPNKPVVPPKKDAAYLRRTEPPVQPQATQESSNKFGKFQTAMLASSASNVGNVPVTSAASSAASQQATAATAPLIANVLAEEANRNP